MPATLALEATLVGAYDTLLMLGGGVPEEVGAVAGAKVGEPAETL
jgi:hypothetical protein